MKKEKGITLIALVITIIVLLILAGVTIVTLTGDNGLLQKAQTAKEENEDAKELELIKLAVSAAQLAGQGSITTDNLNGELRENFSDNSINVDEKSGGWFFKKNKQYTIYKDGKVQEGDLILLPKEYQQVEYIESTGTQWIDTKIPISVVSSLNNNFNLRFAITETGRTQILAGTDYNGKQIVYFTQKIRYDDWVNGAYGLCYSTILEKNKIYDICQKNGKFIFDNNSIEIKSRANSNVHFGLFARISSDGTIEQSTISKMKLYEFKIDKNEQLLYNFIPCYSTTSVKDVDGIERPKDTIGLYDLVEGKFYTNQGTGTFGYGMEDGTYVAPTNN